MTHEHRTVKPGRRAGTVVAESGEVMTPPADWALLAPGDGPLTKLVKAKGPTWLVQVKMGRRMISQGIWARGEDIEIARRELEAKRHAPGYDRKRAQELVRKEKKHLEYVHDFYVKVVGFLDFHPRHAELAAQLARVVTEHATPIGSGTVARTERIPLADRARAAVVAWLRHQTTGYDRMAIARIKGRRREVRRELASRSMAMLHPYRKGDEVGSTCPLQQALLRCSAAGAADAAGSE